MGIISLTNLYKNCSYTIKLDHAWIKHLNKHH